MNRRVIIRTQMVLLALCVGIIIPCVADDSIDPNQLIELLEAAETEIVSVSATIMNNLVFPDTLPPNVPSREAEYIAVPGQGKRFLKGIARVKADPNISEGYIVDSFGFKCIPFLITCDGSKRIEYNTALKTAAVCPVDFDNKTIRPLITPTDFLGWSTTIWLNVPLHQIFQNRLGERPSGGTNHVFHIERISRDMNFPGDVWLVELGIALTDEQGNEIPTFKMNFWFDMERSLRPIRFERYDDRFGNLQIRYDSIELAELLPGLWFPVKGRQTKFKHPDLLYLGEDRGNPLQIRDRQARWNMFEKTYPDGEILEIAEMEAKVVLNEVYSDEVFRQSIPSGYTVWDDRLQESYTSP